MYKFTFHFIGREKGAIDIVYRIVASVEAEQEADARLLLYDRYEHISVKKIRKEKVNDRQ